MIRIDRRELQNIETSLSREWLETNGLGGYASSTVLGVNTRKHHGLLVAALDPPVERSVLVSRTDETLIIGGKRFELSSSEYEGTIHPDGHRYLAEVRLDPYPVFTYVISGCRLEKSIFMPRGENTTYVGYTLECSSDGPRRSQVVLEVRPIIACRDHNALMRENQDFNTAFEAGRGNVTLKPYEHMPAFNISFDDGRFEQAGYWYHNYHYRREKESGYDASEDLYSPGRLVIPFTETKTIWLAFSTEQDALKDIEYRKIGEIERRKKLSEGTAATGELARYLRAAADAFIVNRGSGGRTIVAGYPWFTDWGRDTMISLPGLTLATGRYEDARNIITTFLDNMKDGLIPNHFPESSSEALYNTIDATLWLFEAARKYYDCTSDGDFIARILPSLREAIGYHLTGTMYGIHACDDGLLEGGVEGVQLTWMDAKVGDRVITARIGKAVEINALWYNALRITAQFCADFGGLAEESRYSHLARTAFQSFNAQFWNEDKKCLYDVIRGDHKDDRLRPNQIFTMSLTYPVLDHSRWRSVVQMVERELLTPFGLRTLSPLDPGYKGKYGGDLVTRDEAYHQGTVWPWLMGPYITAYLKAYGRSGQTVARCLNLLDALTRHLSEAGIGSISEIFDGESPHKPGGCIAQAWSVAELLRTLTEDLFITTSQPQNIR
ncbi:MAG: amylo-alpha-1,6-glucosidase [Candidatus Eisenbacteria bacterium]